MFLHFLWWVCVDIKGTVDPVNIVQALAVVWETGTLHNDTEAPRCCVTAYCLHSK